MIVKNLDAKEGLLYEIKETQLEAGGEAEKNDQHPHHNRARTDPI